ncbi:flagellar hook-basal body protein [Sphingosinicella sp.]|uniref:flagellar hook-basal body protein n=1 Tax=Sphingosinicella sp. TaxID=1917971 RepID=UPI00403787BE
MSGLVESATTIMSASERRLETIANNVSNLATPGFKRQASFVEALGGRGSGAAETLTLRTRADLTQGRMSETGNPLDLAINGPGFFRLRAGDRMFYSRHGQFRRAEDGTLVTAQGLVLQQASGGDLVVDRPEIIVLADGNVLDGERPIGRIALFAPAEGQAAEPQGGSLFEISADAVEEVAEPQLRQRMVEASNVSLGDEMVGMMTALRQAESGARLVQLYDDLMGRAINSFGQVGR